MNTAGNARGAASKTAIRDTMLNLMTKKPVEKITVQELCAQAEVNRSTFYAHFTDIGNLLEQMESDMAEPISNWLFDENATTDSVLSEPALSHVIAYLRAHQAFYRIFFSQPYESRVMRESSEQMRRKYIEPYLERTGQYPRAEFDYQYEFCKAGFLSVVRLWLDSGCAQSDTVIVGLLVKILWRCLK